ncbi:aldose 1-epimerase [Cellulophaga sp. Hel_I_12]|uniref:aldose 1-epimerase n=1 Tax=Cellulophaga sp. Hel_I_12 TaxID=1249972 RepID=UPI000646F3A7|nr:aldose 1-epimerase [Cellulophaga sp. Hel_I_12]
MTKLFLNTISVKIDAGELVSYQMYQYEFMHQKGDPGWRNADTEMFPIIGPTADANFSVRTPKGAAIQDQHGLLRELEYHLIESSDTMAIFKKRYTAHTKIKNSKYPDKSSEAVVAWPYDFEFLKKFELNENGLKISFSISGENEMPFMLGYHPAFNLVTSNPTIKTKNNTITLEEVLAVGSRAFQVENCNEIVLKDKYSLRIKTKGFHNFMLWTEVPNMVCIEPITFYPYAVEQNNLDKGFRFMDTNSEEFEVFLTIES